ncbi:MAG: hypothetical protein EZS28_004919 [Streblomastix strix]|uniref:Uncharacterized protein n=1 Tax=Streblomastix strix TaxID=222440 RepID=A0A5J4WXN0_9EUKA|nr:MAG: hypothetical protein EZS28_004919 [Streblomastix strix]
MIPHRRPIGNVNQQFEEQRKLLSDIKRQIEFYFSDENLPLDKYLKNEISKDPEGWVQIEVLLTFPKLAALTVDSEVVSLALEDSKMLQVSDDKTKVKRIGEVQSFEEYDRRSLYANGFPLATQREEIELLFGKFGKIGAVFQLRDIYEDRFNGCARITYARSADAERLLASKDQPDVKQMLVFTPQRTLGQRDPVQIIVQSRKEYYSDENKIQKQQLKDNWTLTDNIPSIIVDRLPQSTDVQKSLEQIFKTYIPRRIDVRGLRTSNARVYAFIRFKTEDEAQKALDGINAANAQIGGIVIRARKYLKSEEMEKLNMKLKSVYIRVDFLPDETTEQEIKGIFQARAPIKKVDIIVAQKQFKRCAVLTFDTADHAERELLQVREKEKLNGRMKIKGTVIRILFCTKFEFQRLMNIEMASRANLTLHPIMGAETPGKLIIDGLHQSTTEETLRNELEDFNPGNITFILRGTRTTRGIAEITLQNFEEAQRAAEEMNMKEIDGLQVRAFADGNAYEIRNNKTRPDQTDSQRPSSKVFHEESQRTVFIWKVPVSATLEEIKDSFSDPKPQRIVRVVDRSTGLFRDFANAIFSSVADREVNLVKMKNEVVIKGRRCRMKRFGDRSEEKNVGGLQGMRTNERNVQQSEKLHIANIPPNITAFALKDAFSKFDGEVQIQIVTDIRTGRSRGFGFATFHTVDQARNALQNLNGKCIAGGSSGLILSFARSSMGTNAKLHVSNIPPNVTEKQLMDIFRNYRVKAVNFLPQRNNKFNSMAGRTSMKTRAAFVILEEERFIDQAVQDINNKPIGGFMLNVKKALSNEEKLQRKSEFWKMIKQKSVNIDDLEKEVNQLQQKVQDMLISAQKSREYVEQKEIDQKIAQAGANATDIYVAGLSSIQTDAKLLELFKPYGAVKAFLIRDQVTKQSKGFGFVTFLQGSDAQRATNAINGRNDGGRRINIKPSNNPPRFNQDPDFEKSKEIARSKEIQARRVQAEFVAATQELQNRKIRIMKRQSQSEQKGKIQEEEDDESESDETNESGQCPICMDDMDSVETCSCSGEGHRLCCTCLKASLESDLNAGVLNISCVADRDCTAEYSMDIIEKVLDEKDLRRLQELQALEAGGGTADEEDKNKKGDVQQVRLNETDSDRKKREDEEFVRVIDIAMTNARIRHCPKCGKGIIKEEGCNRISCHCKANFCYCCEKDITDITYGHFNKSVSQCPLYMGDNMKAEQERQVDRALKAADVFSREHPHFRDGEVKLRSYLDIWAVGYEF